MFVAKFMPSMRDYLLRIISSLLQDSSFLAIICTYIFVIKLGSHLIISHVKFSMTTRTPGSNRVLKPRDLLTSSYGLLKLGPARAVGILLHTFLTKSSLKYRPPDVLLSNSMYNTRIDIRSAVRIKAKKCMG